MMDRLEASSEKLPYGNDRNNQHIDANLEGGCLGKVNEAGLAGRRQLPGKPVQLTGAPRLTWAYIKVIYSIVDRSRCARVVL